MKRLAHTQVWPVLRYLLWIAPATAASRSASSSTRNGALPPSSSATFFTVPAHCAMSSLPTGVEPVNESLRTLALPVNSPPMATASPVTTLNTPARNARALRELRHRQCGIGRLRRGFHDERAAGGERRARLARDHRGGEIPRRDGGDDADGLAQHHDAFVGLVAGDDVAVDALAFLGEPFDERGRVGDLALRFRQRLALLGGHDDREIVEVRQHEVEPACA